MSMATRATRALDAAGIGYRLHPYDYDADASAEAGGRACRRPPRSARRRRRCSRR